MKPSEIALIGSAFHILQHELFISAKAHGFYTREDETYYKVDDLGHYVEVDLTPEFKAARIALAHTELSEALEGIRKPHQDEHCPDFTSEEVEYADTIIRILTDAGHKDLRIGDALLAKLEYNLGREMMHGGKKF